MIAGPKFDTEEGKTFLVVKALYGLKSASFSFCSHMAEKLSGMAFDHLWRILMSGCGLQLRVVVSSTLNMS